MTIEGMPVGATLEFIDDMLAAEEGPEANDIWLGITPKLFDDC